MNIQKAENIGKRGSFEQIDEYVQGILYRDAMFLGAAIVGNIATMDYIYSKNNEDLGCDTAYRMAICNGHKLAVEYMIEKKLKPVYPDTISLWIIGGTHKELIKRTLGYLLKNCGMNKDFAMNIAQFQQDTEIIKFLEEYKD